MAPPVQTITGIIMPSYSFIRPADTTAYTAGDLMADVTTSSVTPLSWRIGSTVTDKQSFYVAGVRLKLDKNSVTNAQFRVHLYKAIPTFTSAGDNSAFGTVVATGYASWIGSYDAQIVNLQADGVAGIAVPTEGLVAPQHITGLDPGSSVLLYGLIEVLAAYIPKSAGTITAELLLETN